jgi:hypothetical protein
MTKYISFIAALFLVACSNNPTQKLIVAIDADSTTSLPIIATQQNAEIVNNTEKSEVISNKTKPQIFNFPSNKVSSIVGTKGLKVTIDPQNLETINGAAIGSNIELELKEMTNQRDLFLNDAPTISEGKLLVSGGAYYIAIKSEGNELKLKDGKTLSIQIPKLSDKEMQLFYGERNQNGDLNWMAANTKIENKSMLSKAELNTKPIIKKGSAPIKESEFNGTSDFLPSESLDLQELLDTASKRNNRMSVVEFKKLVGQGKIKIPVEQVKDTFSQGDYSQRIIKQKDSVTGKMITKSEISYYQPTEIKSLGWINCDRFMDKKLDGQIECEFDSAFNINSASIYVIFKNINSLIKENIVKSSTTNVSKLSTRFPIGESVKILALSKTGNTYFSYKSEFKIMGNETVHLKFTPETSVDATTIVY